MFLTRFIVYMAPFYFNISLLYLHSRLIENLYLHSRLIAPDLQNNKVLLLYPVFQRMSPDLIECMKMAEKRHLWCT